MSNIGHSPGWYPSLDGVPGRLQWYDGSHWTPNYQQQPTPAAPAPSTAIAAGGGGGGGGSASTTIVQSDGGTRHLLHFVLTILTAGLWLPIWICVALFGRRGKTTVITATGGGGGGGAGAAAAVAPAAVAPPAQYMMPPPAAATTAPPPPQIAHAPQPMPLAGQHPPAAIPHGAEHQAMPSGLPTSPEAQFPPPFPAQPTDSDN